MFMRKVSGKNTNVFALSLHASSIMAENRNTKGYRSIDNALFAISWLVHSQSFVQRSTLIFIFRF